MKQLTRTFYILSVVFIISSCSSFSPYKVPVLQGNIIEDEDVDKLAIGQTRDQVQFILGTAVIKDPFHESRWDYINSVQIGDEVVTEKRLTVFFDENGNFITYNLKFPIHSASSWLYYNPKGFKNLLNWNKELSQNGFGTFEFRLVCTLTGCLM